jgi:hypothetical protein
MRFDDPNSRYFRLELGGKWEIDELEELIEALRTSYAYYYWVTLDPASVDATTKHLIVRHFWSQRWQLEQTASELSRRIPEQSRLRLASMHYSSPGWIELAGYVGAISAMALCAGKWIKVVDEGFTLYKKIKQYFDDRKLNPPPQKFNLDNMPPSDLDEARRLCFEYGKELGFPRKKIEDMIELTGNPISTLRLMTNLAVEARRLVKLQSAGKLQLPAPPKDDPN